MKTIYFDIKENRDKPNLMRYHLYTACRTVSIQFISSMNHGQHLMWIWISKISPLKSLLVLPQTKYNITLRKKLGDKVDPCDAKITTLIIELEQMENNHSSCVMKVYT